MEKEPNIIHTVHHDNNQQIDISQERPKLILQVLRFNNY